MSTKKAEHVICENEQDIYISPARRALFRSSCECDKQSSVFVITLTAVVR